MTGTAILLPMLAMAGNGKAGKRIGLVLFLLLASGAVAYLKTRPAPTELVLTGIVTTDYIEVSSQVGGRLTAVNVKQGDAVAKDSLVATLDTRELAAARAYLAHNVEGFGSQIVGGEAALRLQQEQTAHQIEQAEASLAALLAQQDGAKANLEIARINLDRARELVRQGVAPREQLDQTRTTHEAAQAQLATLAKQIDAQRAAVALARSTAEQVNMRRSEIQQVEHQRAAAISQRDQADVQLGYSKVVAPISGIVDVLASRTGEVVNPGQPIMTLINPDDFWVRADVEETYIEGIHDGDQLNVRLPSGEQRGGTVFYRNLDGGYATQRDVSRTKRDIKTFEIRLRVDNADRKLAVGMTVYVLLPLPKAAQ